MRMKTIEQKKKWLRMRSNLILSSIIQLGIDLEPYKRARLHARFDGIMGELKGIYWMSKKLTL